MKVLCAAAMLLALAAPLPNPHANDASERSATVENQSAAQRHFEFTYSFTVRNLPVGKNLRIWFPRAVTDEWQTVSVVRKAGDLPLKWTAEPAYGNRMWYAQTRARKSEYKFTVVYDVVRREHRVDVERKSAQGVSGERSQAELAQARYLHADALVPTSGEPAEIARAQTAGKRSVLEKARALYDYTLANMSYDKTGTGWGRGDAIYACNAKRGNCTDFHSLFISMARSQGIPAKFEIGFAVPEKADGREVEVPGYHCWAEFYDAQHGWVPVDISEAWQQRAKAEYFFGAHDAARVQFSTGRDLVLSPKQAGKPLNYFVYPYVEVAGESWANVEDSFSLRELE